MIRGGAMTPEARERKTIVIGLTGGIATGKSTVARMLARRGAVVINADEVGHEVLRRGGAEWRAVVRAFGKAILTPDGEIDRSKLAECVFAEPTARQRLNKLLHPTMIRRITRQVNEYYARGYKLITIEAAVLFEMGLNHIVDEVWVTHAPPRMQRQRLLKRRMSPRDASARISAQLAGSEFIKRAMRVINCNRSYHFTEQLVNHLLQSLGVTFG